MSNVSGGTLAVSTNDPAVINDRLRKIRNDLDNLKGLKGPITTYDSQRYVDSNQQLLHCWGDSGLTS